MKTFPKPLNRQEENECLERLEQGDPEARQMLIERNLRLVAHVLKKYNCSEGEMEDMLSIGTIGLIKAIDSYRRERGSRLATYAVRCIENEILMTLRSDRKRRREVSLFEPIGTDKEGNEIHLLDVMEGDERDIVGEMYQDSVWQYLRGVMGGLLAERELTILRLRYGLAGGEPLTQKETAARLGISRSYVSRIEKRALEKLQEALTVFQE